MLPTAITRMLTELERRDGRAPPDRIASFARALLADSDLAATLVDAVAVTGSDGADRREEDLAALLGAALDEARMARENGQGRGAALIEALEARVAARDNADAITGQGRLAMSGAWVRAGLRPPAALAPDAEQLISKVPEGELPDPSEAGALFEELFGGLIAEAEGDVTAAHGAFSRMLPTLPEDARHMLVRAAVARPGALSAELGCAWLLDGDATVRAAAADGLSDRLGAGGLGAPVLARLTILRSWIAEAETRARLDGLLRGAMRAGIAPAGPAAAPVIHRVVASMVDGSGAQSLAAAVRTGRSARAVAVVLLKQGFGVKDAYVIPCRSATEQREIVARITDEVETFEVPIDYLARTLGVALADGLERGAAPAPGLIDVAQAVGLTELRPGPVGVAGLLALADPEGKVAALTANARGRLIGASRDWPARFPMLASWFEDSDAAAHAIGRAASDAALSRRLWPVLEDRRDHWAGVIARNALLLGAAGERDAAAEFVAVAAALTEGRPLRKTPIMEFVFDMSVEAWLDQSDGAEDGTGRIELDWSAGPASPSAMPLADVPAAGEGELAALIEAAGLTEPWLDGYLTAVCTAPFFVPPPDWLGPLLNLTVEDTAPERAVQRVVELMGLQYNAVLRTLRAEGGAATLPSEVPLLPIWADGYLTAWEATKPCWPAKALGKEGRTMRRMLEQATDGRIDRAGFETMLSDWLTRRLAEQRA
jgi:hypothetical protein